MGDATWQEERRKALAEVLELVDGLEYEKAGRMADATLSTYDLMIALGDLRRETADAERLRSELASEREARETEVASLKRELAAAQALLIKANDICAVVAEGRDVDDDIGGIWLDTSCDITEDANHICDEIESYGTSAIDSYVADATADLRERVAELEGTAAQVCGDVREMARLGNVRLPEPILWLEDILPDEAKRPSEDMPVEAADFSPRSWQRRITAARAEGERAGEERGLAKLREVWCEGFDAAWNCAQEGEDPNSPVNPYLRPSTKEEDGHAEDA